MQHPVTKSDMRRVMRVIHYLWPEISPHTYLADEMESAAMLGLAQAAIHFDPERSEVVDWAFYSQQLAIFRVLDMFRDEAAHPCGITGDGRGKDKAAFEIDRPLAKDGIHNQDMVELPEHNMIPNIEQYAADKEFSTVLVDALSSLPHHPRYAAKMWVMYLSGYSQIDIAKTLKIDPKNISSLIGRQKYKLIEYLTENYYNRYPYPE